MNKKYLVIIFVLLFWGCKKEITFIDNFNVKGDAAFTVIDSFPEFLLIYPVRLLNFKNAFIFSDFRGDKIFTFLDKSGSSFQFGNRGRGPNEFIDGYGLAPLTDTTFVVFDRMQKRVSYFNVNQDTVFCYKKTNVPAINNVFPFNDSIFVTNGNAPFKKNYGVLDLSKDTAYSYIDYPKISEEKLFGPGNQRAYYSHIVRKSNSNRYVGFKASHYIIDIMDLEGTKLKLSERKTFVHNKWEKPKDIPGTGIRGTFNCISSKIAGSDDGIFMCYEMKKNNISQWCILTFDWEGNPLNRYNIPFTPYVLTSSKDSKLHCIALIGDEYKFVEIDMSLKY